MEVNMNVNYSNKSGVIINDILALGTLKVLEKVLEFYSSKHRQRIDIISFGFSSWKVLEKAQLKPFKVFKVGHYLQTHLLIFEKKRVHIKYQTVNIVRDTRENSAQSSRNLLICFKGRRISFDTLTFYICRDRRDLEAEMTLS